MDYLQCGGPQHYSGKTYQIDFNSFYFLSQELGGATVHLVENLPRQLENTTMTKSSALGLFGVPGLTAYIGLLEIGKPKVVRETHAWTCN